ncbi:hypothetical protein BDF14DRAFT_1959085 [Spinellus fusiger]|nr:hypothetical protein BDF14DRAFT_1959085 [Spinellus fusiger]
MESVAVASEKELDRICEEAKMKLVSNVSTTTGRAPTKEEHVELVKAIESMKSTAKLSLVEVKEVAIVHKDKPEILAKKLQAVTDKSHHHISSHYDAARSVIVEEQAKRLDVKKVIKPIGDHKVEKVLAGVVAGAVIASEIKKALPVDKVANTVVVEKKTTAKDMDRIAIVRHEEAQKKVASNRKDAEKKTVCGKKRNDQVVAVIDTSKTTVVGWFTLLIEQISTRVKKGGENVEADIAILIKEKKEHLLKTLKDSHESVKIEFESDSIEHDNSGLLVQAHFEESLKVIETTVNKRIVEIQETVRTQPKSTDKLQTILNSTKEEIIVTLEDTQRSTVEIIEADSKKADSVLVVVDTVDSVKKTIGSWYGRLTLEIGTILASSDCDKEKKVDELVKKANEEITVVISDAKLNIANASKAIKDTAVSTMGDIAIVLDQIQSNVAAQVIQIQEVSRNNAGQPVEEVKKTLSKIIQESEKKIDFDLSGSVAAVVSTTKSTVVVGVEDSVNTISRWFRGFTSKVAGLVKQESSTVDSISETSKNAQVEIEKIIAKATVEFEEHLVKQNLDKVASELARNEYLKSLQTAKNTITAQIVQVEKTVVDAHKAGKTIDVEKQLIEWNDASDDNLKVVFDSNIVITKETDVEKPNQSIIKATVIEENVVLDTKDVKSKEVIVEDKPVELVEKIVEELRVVDVSTTVPNMVTSEIKKQVTVNTDVKLIEIIKEDDFTLDVVKKTVSYWFYYLIEDISVRTKAGVAKEEITQTVEKAQKELVVILEQAKTAGVKYCKSEQDKAYYMEQISWISTNVNAQAVQIEQVAVQATATKSDVKEHMQVLADNASKHVETAFEKVKSVVVFTESKVTQGVSNVTKSLVKHEHKDVEKAKKAQKAVVAVYENTRNASVSWFTIVCQKISDRVKQGGANVEKDIKYIVETAEKDITSVLQKSSVQKIEGVEEIEVKVQMDQAITSAKKTMEVQLLTIKNAAATISSDNSPKASEQLLKICDHSKKEIEDFFVTAVKTVDVVDAEKIEVVENKTSVVQVVKDDVVQVVEVPEEKSVISEITRDIKEQEVALVQTAQDATETVRSWFSVLVEKITALQGQECGDEKTVEKTNAAIVEAQKEIAVKIIELKETAKSQRGVSDKQAHTDSQLDLFFGNLKSTIDNQINVVKSTILEGPTESKESIKTSLQAAAHKLNNEVVTHFDVIQTTNTPVVETKVKRQIVQVIEAPKVQKVQSTISDWYIVLTKRINERINRGGENVTEDVKLITQEAQKELDVTITEAKKSETSQVDVVKQDRAEGQRSFSATLEWIRWNATAQINQINEIASKENISKNNMQAQIENYALVAKQQVGNALTVHAPVKSVEVISEVVRKGSIGEVVIIEETKEQVQERTRKEMTLVVEETKTKLVGWLDALLISTRDIVRVGGANCKQEVALLIKNSEEEATRLVQDAKIKFTTANTSASVHSTETAALIIHAQKQALDCLDSIRETIHSRVTVIEEVVHSEDLTNFELIDQKLISTVTRAKNQLQIVLNSATEKSIAAVFEGRTITWTKSLEIPHSFKDVRVFAFDVTGTAVDYRSTLLKAWRTITVSKQDQLHGFDVQAFIIQWYKFYTIERAVSVRTISDAAVFRLVLIRLLKEKSLEHLFTETEITTLCSFWFRLDLFADTASSVSSIKKQSGMYTVAFSPDLSTRSMVDLARHGCLCWHAQFTSEMFHATTDGSSTEVVVSGTTEILALEHPGQLAVVSANPLVLEAARKQGSRTVLLDRYEEKYEGKFDLKAEGLDVLAQSFQSFLEE